MARLQHSRGLQAGTGCHEGGIILSKKPPEWHLSLPQQRSAFDSILRCGIEERSATDSILRCRKEQRSASDSNLRRDKEDWKKWGMKKEADIVNLLLMNCQALVK